MPDSENRIQEQASSEKSMQMDMQATFDFLVD